MQIIYTRHGIQSIIRSPTITLDIQPIINGDVRL